MQVEVLERELPQSPGEEGPAVQLISADGAMVLLSGKGEWAEVKALAIGRVEEPCLGKEKEWEVHAKGLSYFSRLVVRAGVYRFTPTRCGEDFGLGS